MTPPDKTKSGSHPIFTASSRLRGAFFLFPFLTLLVLSGKATQFGIRSQNNSLGTQRGQKKNGQSNQRENAVALTITLRKLRNQKRHTGIKTKRPTAEAVPKNKNINSKSKNPPITTNGNIRGTACISIWKHKYTAAATRIKYDWGRGGGTAAAVYCRPW